MSEDHRQGYYKDSNGEWQKDRRKTDRRNIGHFFSHHDRRVMKRRKADHDYLERETKMQIEDALEEFAADHDPHRAGMADDAGEGPV